MTGDTDVTAPAVCVACGSAGLVPGEIVESARVADGWARDDLVNGHDAAFADARRARVAGLLPRTLRFVVCPRCGLQMAAPPVLWPASLYPDDQSYPLRWEFFRCLDDLGPAPLDLLELGCGTGEFLEMAAARGHRAVGIDFSATAVARAVARGLPAVAGGFDELERAVGERRFDAVVLFQVIEHLAEPDALFRNLSRWLSPQARLVIACPGPRRYTRLIREHRAGASDFWDYPPQHVLRWTLPALEAFLRRLGWSVTAAAEEPFDWRAVGSHLGLARALYRGHAAHPLWRRGHIAVARVRALLAPPAYRAGTSIYVVAARTGGSP